MDRSMMDINGNWCEGLYSIGSVETIWWMRSTTWRNAEIPCGSESKSCPVHQPVQPGSQHRPENGIVSYITFERRERSKARTDQSILGQPHSSGCTTPTILGWHPSRCTLPSTKLRFVSLTDKDVLSKLTLISRLSVWFLNASFLVFRSI